MTRRDLLALGGMVFASACGPKKRTGYPGYVLIATSGEESLAVVDLTAFQLLDAVPLGAPPTAVIPGGPANHSYVLTPSTGSVHVLDSALNRVRSRKLGDELTELRLSADGQRLLAISADARELIAADSSSLAVVGRHKLAAAPISLDIAPAVYAAVSTSSGVDLFHLQTGQRWHANMPGQTGAVRFRADGQLLLAANLHDRSLTALSVPTLEVIAELPLAMQPENLCFNSDHGQLFVSGDGMDGVAIVFPYHTLEIEQTVLAGRDPGVMACSANPAYLFVGSHSGSDVCILNVNTRAVIGVVDAGQRPTYITTTPDSQYALVLDESAGAMAVIHIPAIRSYHVKSGSSGYWLPRPAAALFTMLSVGDKPVHAAVVPRES